jgi:hypothetical protein
VTPSSSDICGPTGESGSDVERAAAKGMESAWSNGSGDHASRRHTYGEGGTRPEPRTSRAARTNPLISLEKPLFMANNADFSARTNVTSGEAVFSCPVSWTVGISE